MKTEIKISIAILLIGIGLTSWWALIPMDIVETKKPSTKAERIILPKYPSSVYQKVREVKEYLSDYRSMLMKGKHILEIPSSELDTGAEKAQKIIIQDKAFLQDTLLEGKLLRNEMMRVLPVIISVLSQKNKNICKHSRCYQAEKYNFATNSTTRAIIDIDHEKVLSVERYANTQPDISQRLKYVAQAIALHAPEVKDALGEAPSRKDISMANVRGALQESPCENSTHLCVAPTFTDYRKEEALWAIIDLTDLKLVAAKWAGLGKTTTPACISERSLQNRYIMENFCEKDTMLNKNGWEIIYRLTGSDGLEIRDVKFKGKNVLKSAKIVDWHVSYQQKGGEKLDTTTSSYIDERQIEFVRGDSGEYMFGYNDAMGCPMFSTSVVLPFNAPQVRELKTNDGFMLMQDFRNPKWPMACNYRYENRFEFYNDGAFRVVGVNKGRGCGDNAIYRPVMRIDMSIDTKENFYSFTDTWKIWEKEGREFIDKSSIQYSYKIVSSTNQENGYYIEPNNGQFSDGSRGDNATLFVSRFKDQEGNQDLLTLGSCCDLKEDGVERYIENQESIENTDIVLWYVPRIRNDAREGKEYCWADTRLGENGIFTVKVWPCIVGPKFIPISQR